MRERPVFVVARGGRTGSTLVERLLVSTGVVLVGGVRALFRAVLAAPAARRVAAALGYR